MGLPGPEGLPPCLGRGVSWTDGCFLGLGPRPQGSLCPTWSESTLFTQSCLPLAVSFDCGIFFSGKVPPPCDIHLIDTGVEVQRRWRLAQTLALGTDAELRPRSTLCDVTFETTSPGLEGPGPSPSSCAGDSRPAALLAFGVSSVEDSMEILRIGESMQ